MWSLDHQTCGEPRGFAGADPVSKGFQPDLRAESVATFASLDLALEWCEDDLLRRVGEEPAGTEVTLADHELLSGLSQDELERLHPELGWAGGAPGTLLVRQGEPASEVFLVTRGMLSVVREGSDGRNHRLTTLSAGGTFGELAFVDRKARAVDVRADSEVECSTLAFATLGVVVSTLHVANAEVAHLTR
ncbi:MAG: cyclic nucleotide-binding domain-containing protein [Actinomycetota bacterium]|nr:cyclic nucleotide-binding domain-containing protein [Actinomycetota bacterium]